MRIWNALVFILLYLTMIIEEYLEKMQNLRWLYNLPRLIIQLKSKMGKLRNYIIKLFSQEVKDETLFRLYG